MRLLITGAAGFIGRRLASAALDAGHDVRTLTRREWDGWPGVPLENRYFGRLPFAWPTRALDKVDVVLHCAADTSADLARARAVNVVGTTRLAEAARSAGASFIFLSSQSAHPDAHTAYGTTKYEAERVLLSLDGLRLHLVRPGLVCGPGGLFGRVASMARRLPFVPAFMASAIVQPIWVDDLASALLRLAAIGAKDIESPLALGQPTPTRLGALVDAMAAELGKRAIRLPDLPVTLGVLGLEAIGLRPPIQHANLQAMKAVVPMETRDAMRALGVVDRSLKEIVRLALSEPRPADPPWDRRARRVVLVGAGRIGLVHAVTLTGLPGAVLSAIVDRDPRQVRLLRSLGVTANVPATLEEALGAADAVVVATPPSSHLSLARSVAAHGLDLLVEKPAASNAVELENFVTLARESSGRRRLLVGYVMLAMPHVRVALSRLARGDFGHARDFVGLTLLSLIGDGSRQRWETDPGVSGGGVMANSAPHVLSVIVEAFGVVAPETELVRIVSSSVEDSVVAKWSHPQLAGIHYSSWCIPGYERQENRLSVRTDAGELVITTTLAAFLPDNGPVEVDHQLDHDIGFNIAPDYSGSGIAAELRALTGGRDYAAASIDQAARIERQLFSMYEGASSVGRFSPQGALPVRVKPKLSSLDRADLVLDARSSALFATPPERVPWDHTWSAVQVDADTLPHARRRIEEQLLRVTIPNFLPKARLLSEHRYASVVRAMGLRGLTAAGLHTAAIMPAERGVTFWAAAVALVSSELARIPRSFRGALLLHPYLSDLAIALERYDQLERLLGLLAAGRRRAGLHSNLGKLAANALTLVNTTPAILSVLASPGSSTILSDIHVDLTSIDRLRAVHLTAEVGPAPVFVHRAVAFSELKIAGADSVLVSALVDARVFGVVEGTVRQRWRESFPGLDLPGVVLE